MAKASVYLKMVLNMLVNSIWERSKVTVKSHTEKEIDVKSGIKETGLSMFVQDSVNSCLETEDLLKESLLKTNQMVTFKFNTLMVDVSLELL